jgi:CubicO group peptidase (beta-lactamase class C family)
LNHHPHCHEIPDPNSHLPALLIERKPNREIRRRVGARAEDERRTLMKPETVGMSSARLARLDQAMQRRYVDSGYYPGTLAYVYRSGQLVHTSICGQMDVARGKPMREDTIFRIFSMSKPITVVAFMTLFEEGLIGLDDAVRGRASQL